MRRCPPIVATLALLLLIAPAPAAAVEEVPLRVKLTACTTGETPPSRGATFTASMPRSGAARIQMRFSLLQRLGETGEFRRVRGVAGWDRWTTAEPGRPGLLLTRRVQELAAPAGYRAVVRFRWLRPDGTVLRAARRTSRTCAQPDPRPELRLGELTATAVGDRARYRVEVRNAGPGTARAFDVVLLVGGERQRAVAAGPIGGGGEQVVEVLAPRCAPGSQVEVLLDAQGEVAESREDDNAVRRACPAAAASA